MVGVLDVDCDQHVAGTNERTEMLEGVVADGPFAIVDVGWSGVGDHSVEGFGCLRDCVEGEDAVWHGSCILDAGKGAHVFGHSAVEPLGHHGAECGLSQGVVLPTGEVGAEDSLLRERDLGKDETTVQYVT
jgi:hypothetical protein